MHTLTQNVRGLPQVSQDGNVLNDRYSYDNNANVSAIIDQVENVTSRGMEYDALDRLKRVNAPALWGDAWYNYDTLDNLTYSYITSGGKARQLNHTVNPNTNRIDSINGTYNIAYAYDSQGNVIDRGGHSYSFDIGNRMRGAPGVTTHTYDGLGRRVSVVGTDGVNRVYVYGQEGKLLYSTATGQPLASGTKYIYMNNHVIAEVGNGVMYDHTDGLGSPVAQTNAVGGLISRTRYEPYGATAAGAEPTIGFTGHLNSANLGLIDMQQRFYDPLVGVFLSIDPVVTDINSGSGFNRYGYAMNNPYGFIDPDGREEQRVDDEMERQRIRNDRETERLCGTGQCAGVTTVHSSERSADGGESKPWGSYLPGTETGQSSMEYWAYRQAETGNVLYAVPGLFAALWTPDTAMGTTSALIGGGVASWGIRLGSEIPLGNNFRLAIFGNRTGNKLGELPHYHRRGVDSSKGQTKPGQGIGRHRPWEKKSTDKSFWDRF